MTRSEIELAVLRWTGNNTSSIDTTVQTRVRHFVNRRYRRMASDAGLRAIPESFAFSSVADQSRYAFPSVDAITAIRDTSNDVPLLPLTQGAYRRIAPDPDDAPSNATHWVDMGYEPVAKHPSDASSIFLDSTNAGDTQVAYVEADITGGYTRTLSVSLTGTTAVNLSSTVSTIIRIRKFYLASAAAGIVTMHEDADGGTELARIGIGHTKTRYLVIHLYPQPSSVLTYAADVEVPITDLAQDTDEPKFPERFHDLLEWGAAMDELVKTDDARYRVLQQKYEDLDKEWIYWCAVQRTGLHAPAEFSQLGAWYPHGS